jgi:hypothetical protein
MPFFFLPIWIKLDTEATHGNVWSSWELGANLRRARKAALLSHAPMKLDLCVYRVLRHRLLHLRSC